MPAQLLQRLNRFLDQTIAQRMTTLEAVPRVDDPQLPEPIPENDPLREDQKNHRAHWPRNFGSPMTNVQSIMIHETSGWSTHAESDMFLKRFSCLNLEYRLILPTTTNPNPRWSDNRGIGPQYFIDSNGTTFMLIGQQNFTGNLRETWHGEYMNDISVGIENGNIGDAHIAPSDLVAANSRLRHLWRDMTGEAEDLPGMKLYLVLHPQNNPQDNPQNNPPHNQDAALVWLARFPQFTGSGDIVDGPTPATTRALNPDLSNFRNMLFTERNYRSLALLSRLLAEKLGVPRNFPLLPYLGDIDDVANRGLFRQLILSDQRRDAIAQKLGTTTEAIQANGAVYANFYPDVAPAGETPAQRPLRIQRFTRIWRRFFGAGEGIGVSDLPCFRGILSHDINGNHSCPGPLFDWHRFAREVWDWWWYPFDFGPQVTGVSTTRRPYVQARRLTPLIEYYYDANGNDNQYNQLREPQDLLSVAEKFRLPVQTPVYALANGVVVAARFAISNSPVDSGFLLVRHEVFHQNNGNRIDYDQAPTFVWSLIYFLDNPLLNIPAPPPAAPGATSASNPDWLNRFIMRLRESELSVRYHRDNPTYPALNRGWDHAPSSAGPRLTTGQEIERDATAYRAMANDLQLGRAVLFPLESQPAPTPVRVILGDFLGFPNRMSTLANSEGVQIEIFSLDRLNVPGAVWQAVSASSHDWWRDASAATRTEGVVGADLPANGMVWRYPMTEFLSWVNGVTWASEWRKYGVNTPGGTPAPAPPRPITRIVS